MAEYCLDNKNIEFHDFEINFFAGFCIGFAG